MTSVASLRQLAQRYQSWGLPAIPLRQGKPLMKWDQFQERPPAPDDTVAWPWERADGLAIICGHQDPQSGKFWWVWDIEPPFRERAEAWLDAESPGWRNGLVAESQRGGLHLYCLSERPVPTGKHPWGDIRGVGGLVFAPPTKAFKPDAKQDYRWLSAQPEEALELEPDDLPQPDGPQSNGHRQEPLSETLKRTIPKGARHLTLVRVAGWLRGDGHLEPDEVLQVLRAMNRRCEEPLPDDELEAIASSTDHWEENPILITHNGRGAAASPGTPVRTPVRFTGRPAPPPRTWLVADVIPEGLPALLYGNGGSAKSYLAALAGLAVAAGVPWLGKPTVQRPVLYADFELDEAEQHRRVRRLVAGLGLPDVPEAFEYVQLGDLTPQDAEDVLASWILANPTGLVIVDSVGAAAVSDQEKALAVVQIFRGLRSLNPGGLLLVDHQSKLQAGQDYREKTPFGSVYKFNLSRVIWQSELVESQPGEAWLLLRNTKNNLGPVHGELGVALTFEADRVTATTVSLTSGPLVERASLESRILSVLTERGPSTAQELAEALEAKVESVKAKLSRLKGLGRVVVVETVGREYRWGVPADDQGPSLTLTTEKSVNVNDDPRKPNIPHHEAKNAEHPLRKTGSFREFPGVSGNGEHETASSLTLTTDIGVNVNDNDDPGKPDISDAQAKIGEQGLTEKTGHDPEKPDISDADAKTAICEWCGAAFGWSGRGKPAKYCSDACRKKAARQQAAEQAAGPAEQAVLGWDVANTRGCCVECGGPLDVPGFKYFCGACAKAEYDRLGIEDYPPALQAWLAAQAHRRPIDAPSSSEEGA